MQSAKTQGAAQFQTGVIKVDLSAEFDRLRCEVGGAAAGLHDLKQWQLTQMSKSEILVHIELQLGVSSSLQLRQVCLVFGNRMTVGTANASLGMHLRLRGPSSERRRSAKAVLVNNVAAQGVFRLV